MIQNSHFLTQDGKSKSRVKDGPHHRSSTLVVKDKINAKPIKSKNILEEQNNDESYSTYSYDKFSSEEIEQKKEKKRLKSTNAKVVIKRIAKKQMNEDGESKESHNTHLMTNEKPEINNSYQFVNLNI